MTRILNTSRRERRLFEESRIENSIACLNVRSLESGADAHSLSPWRDGRKGPFEGLEQVRGIERQVISYRSKLQGYVDSWIESGCNFTKWQEDNPAVFERVQQAIDKNLRIWLAPGPSGSATATWLFKPTIRVAQSSSPLALLRFAELLCSPLGGGLRRCPRCHDYFLNKSGHRRKIYCKRRCATHASAEKSTRVKRERERDEKLARAKQAIESWERRPWGRDWKRGVATRAGLTLTWLTRALHAGDLREPRIRKGGR